MMIGDLFKYWTYQVFSPGTVLREKYDAFKILLEQDQLAHEGMAELQRIYHEALPVDACRIKARYHAFSGAVGQIVDRLAQMCPGCYADLKGYHAKFDQYIRYLLSSPDQTYASDKPHTLVFSQNGPVKEDLVGGKAHQLFNILSATSLPVPAGFVVTTNAYRHLVEHNRLKDVIEKALARIHPDEPASLASVSEELTALMMAAEFPPDLATRMDTALMQLTDQRGHTLELAVRSSAVGEDSANTFAGQYRSCLHVSPADLHQAYRRVLASKFSPAALYYRLRSGLEDGQLPMAVMVMEMIEPVFSGVLYTRGPTRDKEHMISVHYVAGLGEALVGGLKRADEIAIPWESAGPETETKIRQEIEAGKHDQALDAAIVSTLAHWARQLEDLLQTPCDVEWCLDTSGRLHLLQCRPLRQHSQAPPASRTCDLSSLEAATIKFQGGDCACAGIGGGHLFKITNETELTSVPENSVALLPSAQPHHVTLLDRVNAVIIEKGSVAGHFQAVAREFNIPTIVNAEKAGDALRQGEPVTVDAGTLKILAGYSPEVAADCQAKRKERLDTPLLRKLSAAMEFIAPLELIDPHAPSFAPQSCRSMHDIIRFAHEKAVYEMFAIGDRRLKRKKGARQLMGDLPMVIYVLDVGGGIHETSSHRQTVKIEHVNCEPMQALWKGLLHPDIQWAGHHHFDWAEYDRLVMNGGIISPDSAMLSSYAVVADHYLNFCMKFGYHFAIIDTLLQPPPQASHIWFRFTGGGGDPQGRTLRVQFIRDILTALGFAVKIESELINARCNGADSDTIAALLVRIGHLLGVTRLMDMHLKDEETVTRLVKAFLNQQLAEFIWEAEGDQNND